MANPYELSSAEHDRIYNGIARKVRASEPQENPRAIIIGGQPGSGKGGLTEQATRELHQLGGVVLVDVDKLRSRHPDNNQLMRENDRAAANLTHNDASKWAKRLTNDAIEGRRNLVIDQTSKSPDTLIARTKQLKEAGYNVEFRVMAVNAETSEQRIHTRYEREKAVNGGAGRFTPKAVHDAAYVGIPQSVAALEREKTVDAIQVYDKHQQRIYENTLHKGEWVSQPPGAKQALERERDRPLTLEDHKEHAQAYTELVAMMDKRKALPAEREDIEGQRLKADRRLAAATFRQVPAEEALKTHPELAGAYAAVAAVVERTLQDGLTAQQRRAVEERARFNTASAIEQGRAPQLPEKSQAVEPDIER
jgi:UDP-N-acetylglucosamine kinase